MQGTKKQKLAEDAQDPMEVSEGSASEPEEPENMTAAELRQLKIIAYATKTEVRKSVKKEMKKVQTEITQEVRNTVMAEVNQLIDRRLASAGSAASMPSTTNAPSTRLGTSTRPGTSFTSTSRGTNDWKPGYVELKGWVTDWSSPASRANQSITTDQLEQLFEAAIGVLPQHLKSIVCGEKSRKMNAGRMLHTRVAIGLKDEGTKAQAWDIRDAIKTHLIEAGHPTLPQQTRVVVENPQWKKALFKEAGQMREAMESLGAESKRIHMETKFKGTTLLYLGGHFGTTEARTTRPIMLAEYHEGKGWAIDAAGLRTVIPDKTCEQVLETYRECQR